MKGSSYLSSWPTKLVLGVFYMSTTLLIVCGLTEGHIILTEDLILKYLFSVVALSLSAQMIISFLVMLIVKA